MSKFDKKSKRKYPKLPIRNSHAPCNLLFHILLILCIFVQISCYTKYSYLTPVLLLHTSYTLIILEFIDLMRIFVQISCYTKYSYLSPVLLLHTSYRLIILDFIDLMHICSNTMLHKIYLFVTSITFTH